MNCAECLSNLSLFSLDLISDIERTAMRRHLAVCESCSREAASYASVVTGFGGQSPQFSHPEEGWIDRIEQGVWQKAATAGGSRPSGSRPVWRRAAIAALLVVVPGISLVSFLLSGRHTNVTAKKQNEAAVVELWSVRSGLSASATSAYRPVMADGMVFALHSENGRKRIVAYDVQTGERRWTGEEGCLGRPVSRNGLLYAVFDDGGFCLLALDARSGLTRWRHDGRDDSDGAAGGFHDPVVNDRGVWWASGKELRLFESSSGKVSWKTRLPGGSPCAGVAAVMNGVVAASPDSLFFYDGASGAPRVSAGYPERMSGLSRPLIAADGFDVYIAHRRLDNSGAVYCFDGESGALRWRHDAPQAYYMEYAAGVVLLRAQSVYALDPETGACRWSVDAGGCSPIASVCGACFVSGSRGSGQLLGLDLLTGAVLHRYSIGGACGGLVMEGTRGFLLDNAGVMHALDMSSIDGCG